MIDAITGADLLRFIRGGASGGRPAVVQVIWQAQQSDAAEVDDSS
jgi:hypothetical protein